MKAYVGMNSEKGFTLIELLIAMCIFAIVLSGIYTAYSSQQKSYQIQQQVSVMQQNLRASILFMEREIRMAGYDPTKQNAGRIVSAGANSMRFTMDLNEDGDVLDADEDITYALYDANGDGIMDLGRNTGAGNVLVAERIDALNFVYLDQNDAVTAVLNDIRSVQIALLARTDRADQAYANTEIYNNRQGTLLFTGPGDGFRRRLLINQVKCRNIGLP